jgi:hypothetical protein
MSDESARDEAKRVVASVRARSGSTSGNSPSVESDYTSWTDDLFFHVLRWLFSNIPTILLIWILLKLYGCV